MDNFVAHILVFDDDEGIRTLVKKYLNENITWLRQQIAQKMLLKKYK